MERLHKANDMIEVSNYEQALVEFNKIIFYDKNSKYNSYLFSSRSVCREGRNIYQIM